MTKIANKFLLAGDKYMPEMHLKQPRFAKNKERIQKFKARGDSKYIYRYEIDKAYFQHDMPYRYFKDLARRTASDKGLRNKSFNITKNSKYYGYQ